MTYCQECHSEEKALFMIGVMSFVNKDDPAEAGDACRQLVKHFLRRGGSHFIGIGLVMQEHTLARVESYLSGRRRASYQPQSILGDPEAPLAVGDMQVEGAPVSSPQGFGGGATKDARRHVFALAYQECKEYLDSVVLPKYKSTDDFQVRKRPASVPRGGGEKRGITS